MIKQLKLGEIAVDVVFKDIKNVHLSVYPPNGKVRISAPKRMNLDTIRVFAISKLGWIKQQQKKLQSQERETPREYLDRESHYVWGKRYLLKVVESNKPLAVELKHNKLLMHLPPATCELKKKAIIEHWYRDQLKHVLPTLISTWEPRLGVKVRRFFVQRMKTKWGSCSVEAGSIRINTELAKKPTECLEYIVLHEMTHLLVRHHNANFIAILDKLMPSWRSRKQLLNSSPLAHEDWQY